MTNNFRLNEKEKSGQLYKNDTLLTMENPATYKLLILSE